MEKWQTIKEYHNYDISNFGNIRNNKTKKKPKFTRSVKDKPC